MYMRDGAGKGRGKPLRAVCVCVCVCVCACACACVHAGWERSGGQWFQALGRKCAFKTGSRYQQTGPQYSPNMYCLARLD